MGGNSTRSSKCPKYVAAADDYDDDDYDVDRERARDFVRKKEVAQTRGREIWAVVAATKKGIFLFSTSTQPAPMQARAGRLLLHSLFVACLVILL